MHSAHLRSYFLQEAFPVINGEMYLLEEKHEKVLAYLCELIYQWEEELKDLKD